MVVVCTSEEGADLIRTQAGTYEVMEENRDGWNPEAFKERYSDILDKYDYIVGDWGYGQLRLRGFYSDANRKVPFEQRISALDEYLQEFCNFGCPYFVLQKVKGAIGSDEHLNLEQAAYDADGEDRQDFVRDEMIYTERKERRRFHPRQNKQERSERGNSGAQVQRSGAGRSERSDKPKLNKEKNEKGRDNNGKERRPNQARANREHDRVSSAPVPNQPKR
ncbi:YutD-like domain-containing protein [Brevibacillus panacihumi]|uniref:YutD family protein n=1 Tax=Brevibacillus panacihumi TaxID=497735 RepID=UPI0004CDDE1B